MSEPRARDHFEKLGSVAGQICDTKNRAYGDSAFVAAECLKILAPDGVGPAQYPLLTIFARDIDKWARLFRRGNNELDEDAALDRVGYALLLADYVSKNKKRICGPPFDGRI